VVVQSWLVTCSSRRARWRATLCAPVGTGCLGHRGRCHARLKRDANIDHDIGGGVDVGHIRGFLEWHRVASSAWAWLWSSAWAPACAAVTVVVAFTVAACSVAAAAAPRKVRANVGAAGCAIVRIRVVLHSATKCVLLLAGALLLLAGALLLLVGALSTSPLPADTTPPSSAGNGPRGACALATTAIVRVVLLVQRYERLSQHDESCNVHVLAASRRPRHRLDKHEAA
jgi:hypothetical protein